MCVLALRRFFSSGRGPFLVLVSPWHAGSPPGPHTKAGALAEVRGICSGCSKWHLCSGRDSEHVEPSGPLQTYVQVKRTSDVSRDIWDFECHQCRQTILTWLPYNTDDSTLPLNNTPPIIAHPGVFFLDYFSTITESPDVEYHTSFGRTCENILTYHTRWAPFT